MTKEERLDAATLAALPVCAVPRYSPFSPLDTPGQRLLLTRDGPMLEVARRWLYTRLPCGQMARGIRLPYGLLEPTVETVLDRRAPGKILGDFIAVARDALPNEVGGAVIWNERSDTLRLHVCNALSASPGHLTYELPRLGSDEHLVIDIHSHGHGAAGFSATDDADDAGTTKLSYVVGHVDKDVIQLASRLCAMGLFYEFDRVELPYAVETTA